MAVHLPEKMRVTHPRMLSIQAVESNLDRYLETLPTELRDSSSRLAAMFHRPFDETKGGWFGHFSPLALLYPRVQLHALVDVPKNVHESAQLAHVQLLIHAVLEDRILDGQFRPDAVDALFAKQLFSDALASLIRIQAADGRRNDWLSRLLDSYTVAQCRGYNVGRTPPERKVASATIRSVVCGRGHLGLLTTMVLAEAYVADSRIVWLIRNAFDALMMGMQWADDLRDWQDDLRLGDENLLLHALRLRGLDPYSHPDDDVRLANVGHALVSQGILDLAESNARRWFEAAAARQQSLGCDEMAALIEQKVPPLAKWRQSQLERIEQSILLTSAAVAFNALQ